VNSTIRLCGKCGTEIPAGAPEEGYPGCLLEAALDAAGGQVVFGRYILVKLLGGGGIGIVWLARDKGTTHRMITEDLGELDRSGIAELTFKDRHRAGRESC